MHKYVHSSSSSSSTTTTNNNNMYSRPITKLCLKSLGHIYELV